MVEASICSPRGELRMSDDVGDVVQVLVRLGAVGCGHVVDQPFVQGQALTLPSQSSTIALPKR